MSASLFTARDFCGRAVKADLHHIAVLDQIFLTLNSQLSGLAAFCERSEPDQVFEMDGLRRDEATFKVGMNHTGGRGSSITGTYCQGACLFVASCEISP